MASQAVHAYAHALYVLPMAKCNKLRSFTMRAPATGTSSIAMNVVTQGFYVAATSTTPWVLDVAKFHGVAVRVL